MKFVFLVEGQTEQKTMSPFLKRWLDPQLKQPVQIEAVKFNGCGDFHRKAASRARAYLESPRQQEIIAVVGLLDLYGPEFYPKNVTSVQERYEWGVNHFKEMVHHDRFRMFFAVHEIEAWLLSAPQIFPSKIIDLLPRKVSQPETVNFDMPPAVLLDHMYQQATGRSYKKSVNGFQLFSKLDPVIAAAKCPYLKSMLADLLQCAKTAGL